MAAIVRPLKLNEVPSLHRRFGEAIDTSFAYIKPQYRVKIRRDNNLIRLGYACVHPQRILLAAVDEGDLLGYAIGAVGKTQADLYWLYVSPKSRGQQLGLKLLQTFEQSSRQQGVNRVGLSTYDHHTYYAAIGYNTIKQETLHGVPMKIMVKDISL
ncbi:N-acetyltransferase [Patescibacteria group bacterium]|nr:MAG: N-acetyltransferase [Patescibacteria group bacterium]